MTDWRYLVLDTATRTPVVAIADGDWSVLAKSTWTSQHRHGEELLQRIDGVLAEAAMGRSDIRGVIVGTGPGSFTGLRIGLATAKTIAYALHVPLVGVSTSVALAHAAWLAEPELDEVVVTLPAGTVDRYEHRVNVGDSVPVAIGDPLLVPWAASSDDVLVAIDLAEPTVDQAAIDRGQRALDGLAGALISAAADRLTSGVTDDPGALVPTYVAVPRGIKLPAGEMTWSPDLR